jgi:hypothetical protein
MQSSSGNRPTRTHRHGSRLVVFGLERIQPDHAVEEMLRPSQLTDFSDAQAALEPDRRFERALLQDGEARHDVIDLLVRPAAMGEHRGALFAERPRLGL